MFTVVELQRNGDTLTVLTDTYSDLNQAKSKYHTVLAYAAISEVDIHAASLLDDEGICILHEAFDHMVFDEGEPNE